MLAVPGPTQAVRAGGEPALPYGDAGRWNRLDLYRHRAHPAGCPTLVYFHGGAFKSSKHREARPLLYSQGWVCVSADYRLSPPARFPDHLVDAKKVIAWVGSHGQRYGADPRALFVAGTSAGARLATMARPDRQRPGVPARVRGCDTSVTAAVGL